MTHNNGYITVQIPIDSDPNVLGETLREALFKQDPDDAWSTGCYTTFEVRDDAVAIYKPKSFFVGLDHDYRYISEEFFNGYEWSSDSFTFEGYWIWDGDGHLVFRILDENENVIRIIENPDCKKSYGWEDVK